MKIPEYINKALSRRTKYAVLLDKQMQIVDAWLDKNGIECDTEDTHRGAEIYINPEDSEERIRAKIEVLPNNVSESL